MLCQEETELGRGERAREQDVQWGPAVKEIPLTSGELVANVVQGAVLDLAEAVSADGAIGKDGGGSLRCLTLREVAPDVEIYALGTYSSDEAAKVPTSRSLPHRL